MALLSLHVVFSGSMHGVPFASNSDELSYEPIEIPFVDTTSTSQNGNDFTICVMTVDQRNYPELATSVATWRQSLEADEFTRLEDIGEEDLCLWPNWEEQDYYCHYRLTHNALQI